MGQRHHPVSECERCPWEARMSTQTPLRRIYDEAAVRALLLSSENRNSPVNPLKQGHGGKSHVSISRVEMNLHADRPQADVELATAFLSFSDQVRAAMAMLNHHAGQGALDFLGSVRSGTRRVFIE